MLSQTTNGNARTKFYGSIINIGVEIIPTFIIEPKEKDQSSVQIKHIVPVFFCYFRFVFAATATNYFYKAAVDPTAMQYVHQNRPDFSATRYWAVPAVKVTGGI